MALTSGLKTGAQRQASTRIRLRRSRLYVRGGLDDPDHLVPQLLLLLVAVLQRGDVAVVGQVLAVRSLHVGRQAEEGITCRGSGEPVSQLLLNNHLDLLHQLS